MSGSVLAALSYDPLLRIHLGPIAVSPHGIMTAVGLLVGIRILLPVLRRTGLDVEAVLDVVTKAILGGILGARLAYVLNHLGTYTDDPLGVVKVLEGGLSLLGGLAGAAVVGAPLARRAGLPVVRLLDLTVPSVAVGIAVGRIGDLVIADHLGKPTDFALGYVCPATETGSRCIAPVGQAVHQTALYDLVGAGVLAIVLLTMRRRSRCPRGTSSLVFGAAYGAIRFIEGFFRIDVTHGTWFNGSQWTALAVGTGCVIGLVIVLRRRVDEEPPAPVPTSSSGVSDH
jgi:phosphatidylglycerol:prolipoprotein diacylglycerol transferase